MVLLVKSKEIYYDGCFLEFFSKFSEQPFCKTFPVSCFSNLLKSSGWMTVTYFFFGHLRVFWVFFLYVRVTLELRRKTFAMEASDSFVFFAITEKISFFGGEILLRKLLIQSINKFLENRDQNSLGTRSLSTIFD